MSTPGPDDPLPVKSRQDAQDWAKHMTESMAQTAGVTLDTSSVEPIFSDCVGNRDEVRQDGRYKLSYAVYSSTPLEQHPEAVRKARTMLEQQGFTIDGYRERANGKVDAVLDASQASSRYLVTVQTTKDGLLAFSVNTPCLMPPPQRQRLLTEPPPVLSDRSAESAVGCRLSAALQTSVSATVVRICQLFDHRAVR
ncbi:hypothetical protein ABT247_20075 [Kitasatospora sp. NPDC001539]|uniref:hypothetical protein n=1 Tax=Kitasatospora sp. NPDC001539 TaxID=3154384 RepID=UPI0033223504